MRQVLIGLLALAAACGGGSEPSDAISDGRALFSRHCAVCHGGAGEGGVGPALAGVAATFPDCDEQVNWMTLGSVRWREEVGPTYGAEEKVSEGVMPSFEGTLTDTQMRTISAYERHRFAELDEGQALGECGVAAGPGPGD